jgi:hypothetical protein
LVLVSPQEGVEEASVVEEQLAVVSLQVLVLVVNSDLTLAEQPVAP